MQPTFNPTDTLTKVTVMFDRQRLKSLLPTVVFWVAVASMLGIQLAKPLLGYQVLTGYDMLDRFSPWSALPTAQDEHYGNPYITDQLDSQLPSLSEITHRISEGDWPLHSNLVQGGAPLLAVPSLAFLTPTRFLWLVLPISVAPAWVTLAEAVFSAGFAYLFARRLRFSLLASLVTGFATAFSGFSIAWNGWPQSTVVAFIPMLLWSIERVIQQRRVRDLVPVALAVAFLILGGFPVVAGHSLIVAGFYALARSVALTVIPSFSWRSLASCGTLLGGLLLSVITGFGLSAFQLIPFATTIVSDADLNYRSSWSSIQDLPVYWMTTILPRGLNIPFAPQDAAAFIGAAVLVSAVLGCLAFLRGGLPLSVALVFIGTCLFVVAFVSYQNVLDWGSCVRDLPLLANNPPGRLRAQLGLPLAVFSGLGIMWLEGKSPTGQWTGWRRLQPGFSVTSAATVTMTMLFLAYAIRHASQNSDIPHPDFYEQDAAIALIPLALISVLMWIAIRLEFLRSLTLSALLAAIALQPLPALNYFWPVADANEVYPHSEALDYLASRVGHNQLATVGLALRPNVPNIYGIRMVNGHAFVTPEWKAALQEADPTVFIKGGTYSYLNATRDTAFDNPALDKLGVRYVAAAATEPIPGFPSSIVPLPGSYDAPEDDHWAAIPPSGLNLSLTENLEKANGIVVIIDNSTEVNVAVEVSNDSGQRRENHLHAFPHGERAHIPVGIAFNDFATENANIKVHVNARPSSASRAPQIQTAPDGQAFFLNRGDEHFPLVYAGENTLIWERTTALPRIRFEETGNPIQPASIDPAITVRSDTGDIIDLGVQAASPGHVVIAQAAARNFVATVDSQPADIINRGDGTVGIAVGAGEHDVTLEYQPRYLHEAFLISALSAVLVLLTTFAPMIYDRWRRPLPDTKDQRV